MMKKTEQILLAFRNLSRQKRRSFMLAFAIAFGFFVVTAIDGLATGAVENLEAQITQMLGGNVIVQGIERLPSEEEGKKGKIINLTRDENFVRDIFTKSGIKYKYYSQRAMVSGSLIFNGKKVTSNVYGCSFKDEKPLIESFRVDEGSLDKLYDESSIVISRKTADSLKIKVGETLRYSTETINGQNTFGEFTVIAITRDSGLLASYGAYANMSAVNKMIEAPENSYYMFSVTLVDKNDQNKAAQLIEDEIRKTGKPVTNRLAAHQKNPKDPMTAINRQIKDTDWKGTMYGVVSLEDAVPQLNQVMSIVSLVTTIILLVILLIVMVGISNTYRMVLYERIREIGTMRALGMTGKDTGNIFTLEALILALIGAAAGFILAVFGMSIFGLFTFHNDAISFFLHNGHFTYHLTLGSYVLKFILMIVLTVLAVRGSAKQAANLSPATALRTIK